MGNGDSNGFQKMHALRIEHKRNCMCDFNGCYRGMPYPETERREARKGPADRPQVPRTVRHIPSGNCDSNGFPKRCVNCNRFDPWRLPRNKTARSQKGPWPEAARRLQYIRPLVHTQKSQKKHADCNTFVPWCVPRYTVVRNQWGQPTGRWPHKPCVTNQIAYVTPMVFKGDQPTVMNSSIGAYQETQRREAKGAGRPMADPTNLASQTKL